MSALTPAGKAMRGSNATLSLSIGAAALALIGATGAATAQDRAIEQCRQMSNEELRIACLEAALKEAYRAGPATGDEMDRAGTEREADAVPAEPPVKGEKREDAGDSSQDRVAPTSPVSSEPQRDGASDAVVGERNDLGSEQVETRQRSRARDAGDEARLVAGVSAVTTVPYRRLQVTLDNGMIWRQIEGDVQRLRIDDEDASTVEIWETRLGGYKLKFNGLGRTIRVQRVR
jgi:hypothetical protein